MLILKYFVYTGTLLSALLTAPPIAAVEELRSVEEPSTLVEHEKPLEISPKDTNVARGQVRKQKIRGGGQRRINPFDRYARVPSAPFFFGWR